MDKIEKVPNWEEILGGEFSKRSADYNFQNIQKEMYGEFENTFMMYLPRLYNAPIVRLTFGLFQSIDPPHEVDHRMNPALLAQLQTAQTSLEPQYHSLHAAAAAQARAVWPATETLDAIVMHKHGEARGGCGAGRTIPP